MRKLRTLIILLATLCVVPSGFAQKLKVSEKAGKPFKMKSSFIHDIYKDGNEFWSISSGKFGEYYVARYDKNMNFEEGKKIKFDYHGKFLSLEQVVHFKGEYYFFLKYHNQKDGKLYLFYTIFDIDGLITETELTKVAELNGETKKTTAPYFQIKQSEDEQNLLILGFPVRNLNTKWRWSILGPYREHNPSKSTKFSLWVLDNKLKIVNYQKNHKIETEESSDKYEFRDFKIVDDGTIYILGKNTRIDKMKESKSTGSKRKRASSKDWADYQTSAFVLEQINPNGEILQYLTDHETLYSDMAIITNDEGKVGLMGLVGESFYNSIVSTGVEFVDINPVSMEANNVLTEAFTEEVLDKVNDIRVAEQSMSKRRKRRVARRQKRMTREQREMKEIAKRAALKMNDIAYCGYDAQGTPVLILEERWLHIVTTTTTDSRGNTTTTTTYYYHYDDLIIVKFEEDEVIQKPFVKSYVSVNRPLSTPLSVVSKDEFVYIMTASHIIRTETFLDDFVVHDMYSKSKRRSMPRSERKFGSVYAFKKSLKEGTILAAKQRRRQTIWYKVEVD